MRTLTLSIIFAFTTAFLFACETEETFDPETVTAAAQEAITYTDGEVEEEGMVRDAEDLSDDRLIEEAQDIAQYAVDHGCDVVGVLGGVWTDTMPDGSEGGEIHGRWFKLDRSTGGAMGGTHNPGDPDEAGGVIAGEWEAVDSADMGTLEGEYYGFGDGDGYYLGSYAQTNGDAEGMLGGLWYRLDEDGGVFFGVWGHCPEGSEDIDPQSYE